MVEKETLGKDFVGIEWLVNKLESLTVRPVGKELVVLWEDVEQLIREIKR